MIEYPMVSKIFLEPCFYSTLKVLKIVSLSPKWLKYFLATYNKYSDSIEWDIEIFFIALKSIFSGTRVYWDNLGCRGAHITTVKSPDLQIFFSLVDMLRSLPLSNSDKELLLALLTSIESTIDEISKVNPWGRVEWRFSSSGMKNRLYIAWTSHCENYGDAQYEFYRLSSNLDYSLSKLKAMYSKMLIQEDGIYE